MYYLEVEKEELLLYKAHLQNRYNSFNNFIDKKNVLYKFDNQNQQGDGKKKNKNEASNDSPKISVKGGKYRYTFHT